jgi:hypothetical protein
MFEDRADVAEADGDGGEGNVIHGALTLRKTAEKGVCENFSGETVEHEKENAMG